MGLLGQHAGGGMGTDQPEVISQRTYFGSHAGHQLLPAVGESGMDVGAADKVVQAKFAVGN